MNTFSVRRNNRNTAAGKENEAACWDKITARGNAEVLCLIAYKILLGSS